MDIHARLVGVVAEATSSAGALTSATRVVAEFLGAQACLVFVRRGKKRLEVSARFGPPLPAATIDAATAVAEKALADVLPARAEAAGLLAVPVVAINHPIGAIVLQRAPNAPFTAEEIMRLSGVASQIVDVIESARLVETIERAGIGLVDHAHDAPPSVGERVLRGSPGSPGIAIGAATFRNAFPRALVHRDAAHGGTTAEHARVRDAVQKTRNDLVRLQSAAASEIGEEHALIFGAHLLLLSDRMVTDLVADRIAAGHAAPVSIDEAFDEVVRRLLETHDPYIQERVEDIEDLRSRILGHMVGVERQGDIDARVVISARTTPSLVVELKARGALGVASELGGPTSHGVLLARALGVPAVTGIDGLIDEVTAGDPLILDGDEGLVVIRPTADTRADYERRRARAERNRTEFRRYRDEPASTADGVRFELQANIGLGVDLDLAREHRADGIGLYRTEFPFIVRDALPTVEEQVRIYAKAYEAFPTSPITLRLLDLAGDKFVSSQQLGVSRDAFHGYRSIRILFDYPHVLRDQVQAFAIAAGGRELRILIPMVTSIEDVVRIKQLVASSLALLPQAIARGPLLFGAMIETPASVEIVRELAGEIDFFSLGTNDLVQYTLVVDRDDWRMASETHAYHPAIFRMIRRVITQAHAAGKRVTVCGEMATRPDLAAALLALGIDALSVTPRAIPELKWALASVALDPLRASIDDLLAIPTAEGVQQALRHYVRPASPADPT
jgi:phosphotransferase system enzyme I (PtsP)